MPLAAGIGIAFGIEIAIGGHFDFDADSDPEVSRYQLYFRTRYHPASAAGSLLRFVTPGFTMTRQTIIKECHFAWPDRYPVVFPEVLFNWSALPSYARRDATFMQKTMTGGL